MNQFKIQNSKYPTGSRSVLVRVSVSVRAASPTGEGEE
ncbi:hypothetical protein NIES23_42650 [Trichormus variabilis NIES-23]|uniref:Uncharacterized protein n=1 Tax=Trichormus variabilis NIES-23 TaxID=1973479 RepID=A0A1Z4KR65_ANAVA|nr:hypothetical protein NIES23_42650 [Trichormus variabilis NIES-23]